MFLIQGANRIAPPESPLQYLGYLGIDFLGENDECEPPIFGGPTLVPHGNNHPILPIQNHHLSSSGNIAETWVLSCKSCSFVLLNSSCTWIFTPATTKGALVVPVPVSCPWGSISPISLTAPFTSDVRSLVVGLPPLPKPTPEWNRIQPLYRKLVPEPKLCTEARTIIFSHYFSPSCTSSGSLPTREVNWTLDSRRVKGSDFLYLHTQQFNETVFPHTFFNIYPRHFWINSNMCHVVCVWNK